MNVAVAVMNALHGAAWRIPRLNADDFPSKDEARNNIARSTNQQLKAALAESKELLSVPQEPAAVERLQDIAEYVKLELDWRTHRRDQQARPCA